MRDKHDVFNAVANSGSSKTNGRHVAKAEVQNNYPNESRSIILQRLKDELRPEKAKK